MSSNAQNKAATTVKVAVQSGAAKDDFFTGFTEETANQILNILGNDPGSARLWSLDQQSTLALASSQLPQNLAPIVLASGARVSANLDGTVNYEGSSALQSLWEGERFVDSFTYVIRMANGALSTATARVEVIGVNDVAVFSGNASGSVQEDGVLSTAGVLSVSDVDHDQNAFAATGELAGTYGNFSFDLATGSWTYNLRNGDANVQALTEGQSVQDTLQVFSVDGSSTDVVVTIGGANEPVVIANPADKWNVNKQNVTKSGGGLDSAVAYDGNGIAKITGFDANDTLHAIGAMRLDIPFIELIDTDGVNGVDSTRLNFNYKDGGNPDVHVDVILVGYTDFSLSQLMQAA